MAERLVFEVILPDAASQNVLFQTRQRDYMHQ
jgi:hypothetical protein